MNDFDFLLADRVQKIKSINEMYDLENNSYISFSGGKDSTVLSALIDIALPNNKIPRVFINTGIEYKAIIDFVKGLSVGDSRFTEIHPTQNIKTMLIENGYPFKSKEHSHKISIYQNSGKTKTVIDYLGEGSKTNFLWTQKVRYNFTPDFKLKCSDKCCTKLKKIPATNWSKENKRLISITGIRKEEGGQRQSVRGCTIFYDKENKKLHKFHPLLVVSEDWINQFVEKFDVNLCKLYYPPFNFKRTGCKGCPFNTKLQEQLDIMEKFFPAERKQCELLWKPVYDEYRRINYRLKRKEPELF